MGNGIYCDIEPPCPQLSPVECLVRDAREKLEYLKGAQRRLVMMVRQHVHHKRNPLGGPMVKELQIKINQQTLLIERNQRELYAMDKQYNSMLYSSDAPAPAPSLQADWEEVMEMAKIAPENMPARSPASSNSSSETLFKSMYGTTAAESAEAHTRSQQRTFVPQMTPPIEEVVELRERLKVLEQSPLFADPPALMGGALQPHGLATGQRSPYSLP